MLLSIVIPSYACGDSLPELTKRLVITLQEITAEFEILLINDSSPDNDWEIIYKLAQKNNKIKGINLSRNFGQHYAITAGLQHAKGKWVVVMDGDLQDQPEEISKLYKEALKGFDIVYAKRAHREDAFLKKLSSKVFYKTLSYLTDTKQDNSIGNFGIYHRKVIQAILKMNDSIKYFPTMSQWVGFKKTAINVNHSSREFGKSSYNIKSLLKLAFNNMVTFSNKPLKVMVNFGFSIVLITLIIGIVFLVKYFTGNIEVIGYTSLILSIWFLSGVIMMMLGVLGIYLGKVFDQVKDRPSYIISNKINL